jgi:hypothetical protein
MIVGGTVLTVKEEGSGSPQTPLWAYTYQIVPSQTKSRLRAIKALLDQVHGAALHESRTWAGRLVPGARMTRILIVSDTAEPNQELSQRLEAELKYLKATYSRTEPVSLPADHAPDT